jgi:hypothetical protein
MRGFVMLTLYRETPLAPYIALTSVTAQLPIDTMYRVLGTRKWGMRNQMLALTITASAVVLVGAGVLWLKPWIDDYDEISD